MIKTSIYNTFSMIKTGIYYTFSMTQRFVPLFLDIIEIIENPYL